MLVLRQRIIKFCRHQVITFTRLGHPSDFCSGRPIPVQHLHLPHLFGCSRYGPEMRVYHPHGLRLLPYQLQCLFIKWISHTLPLSANLRLLPAQASASHRHADLRFMPNRFDRAAPLWPVSASVAPSPIGQVPVRGENLG